MVIFRINNRLLTNNAEGDGRSTGDPAHTARQEITVDQLKTEYLHLDPSLYAGGLCLQEPLFFYA